MEYNTSSKTEYNYTYDDQGNQTFQVMTSFTWNAAQNFWIPSSKTGYYDNLGTLRVSYIQQWNTQTWTDYIKYEYEDIYMSGKLLSSITSVWIYTINAWTVQSKTEYLYDGSGAQTHTINYSWDTQQNRWRSYYRTIQFARNTDQTIVDICPSTYEVINTNALNITVTENRQHPAEYGNTRKRTKVLPALSLPLRQVHIVL
jgi:hypothetical protein